jgi:sugar phosphate isomerase/epimerase
MTDQIRWIGENGFDFAELFFEEDQGETRRNDPVQIRRQLDAYDLDVICHAAWSLPIGSEFREFRETAVAIIRRYILFSHEIQSRALVVHANWPASLFTPEEGIRFQTESLRQITRFAAQYHVGILYESLNTRFDSMENIRTILAQNPDIGFHADIGHLNLWGREPITCLKAFKDRLSHIHMHDNNGEADLHLPIGTGNIDWDKLIAALKTFYDGTITLEIFSEDKDYVLLSKKKLSEKWAL